MSHYRRYRGRTRIVAPPSVILTAASFALVVGALSLGWWLTAGGAVAAYLVFGGRVGGRAPTWHVFAFAGLLLALCLGVAMYRGNAAGVLAFAGFSVIAGVATIAVSRLAVPPVAFAPVVHLRVDGGEAGCGEPSVLIRAMSPLVSLVTCPACLGLTQARSGGR